MRGYNVLHPIGSQDLLQAAGRERRDQRGTPPAEWTDANIEQQRGRSGAWACRSTGRGASSPATRYCRWTQWLFLQFFEKGLRLPKEAPVNWCPNDQTVLANEQVIGGACERCGTMVERRSLAQWFFKITDYAQRLLDDVDVLVEWPERVLTMQRNWIGRSEGASVIFTIEQTGERIEVCGPTPCGVSPSSSRSIIPRSSGAGGSAAQEVEPMIGRARRASMTDREAAVDTRRARSSGCTP